MAVQSTLFYGTLSWLPMRFELLGWPAERAGMLLGVFTVAQVAAGLLVPLIADRGLDRRPLIFAAVASGTVALLLLTVAPGTLTWFAACLLGIGLGAGFPLGLLLLVDFGDNPTSTSRLTAMVFSCGYGAAALAPIWMGVLRDITGGLTSAFAVLTILCTLLAIVVPFLRPGRQVEAV
jgi:CP family cyanate transporter-like MFS transporter